jgi:type II secretory pathway pseudopilin PulG
MTIFEVVVALGISGLAVAAIVNGYIFCVTSAEKSALSLSANNRAMQRIEEMRSAKWDISTWPVIDQLVSTNFSNSVVTLDVSGSGSAVTYATNFVTISQISTNPPLKRIRVDCVWNFKGSHLITNTIETCRSPDQ